MGGRGHSDVLGKHRWGKYKHTEKQMAEYLGCKYAGALSCGTTALHLATKLAGEKLYGQARSNHGTLEAKKVFCSGCTFDASINPVGYEDGEAVSIDTEYDTWNMSPEALEKHLCYIRM